MEETGWFSHITKTENYFDTEFSCKIVILTLTLFTLTLTLILETVQASKRRKSITSTGMRISPSTNRWSQIQHEQIHTGTVFILSVYLSIYLSVFVGLSVCLSICLSIHEQMTSASARTNTYSHSTHPVCLSICPSMNRSSQIQQEQIHTRNPVPIYLSLRQCTKGLSLREMIFNVSKTDAYCMVKYFVYLCITFSPPDDKF